jgi:hypothetical protein
MAAAIVMGGALTMVGNSPLILLNDLLVAANANLPSGAATLEPLPCSRRCRSASRCWRLAAVFPLLRQQAAARGRGRSGHPGAHRELFRQAPTASKAMCSS